MALGSFSGGGVNPSRMSSLSALEAGFLEDQALRLSEIGGIDWVNSLATSRFGDTPIRINLKENDSVNAPQYYVVEARTRNDGYTVWDQSLPGFGDGHLILYYVDRLNHIATIPGNGILDTLLLADNGVLNPSIDESYLDMNNRLIFSALDERHQDGKYEIQADIRQMTQLELAARGISNKIGSVLVFGTDISPIRDILVNVTGPKYLSQSSLDYTDQFMANTIIGPYYSFLGVMLSVLFFSVVILIPLVLVLAIIDSRTFKKRWPDSGRVRRFLIRLVIVFSACVAASLIISVIAGNLLYEDKYVIHRVWPFGDVHLLEGDEEKPDLDLHVYCDDGRHVGMNYDTGEYEVQIDDVITNGDNQGAPEWIFFPPEGNEGCRHVVSAHDNAEFLAANPDIAAQLPDTTDSYDIYARYIDPASGIYTSTTLEAQSIEPDEAVVHAVAGTTDVTIAPGVVDTTAPVTTAEVTGTLAPDGVTYVGPVTVTLTADDGTDGTGVASLTYSMDGGLSWGEYVAPITFSEEATHTLHFGATDNAGNEGITQTLDITINLPSAELSVLFRRHTVG